MVEKIVKKNKLMYYFDKTKTSKLKAKIIFVLKLLRQRKSPFNIKIDENPMGLEGSGVAVIYQRTRNKNTR